MRLYLDNCCFNRPFDDQSMLTIRLETEAKLHIQTAIRAGQYTLGWSYLLDYENAANPLEERSTEIQRWEELADSFVAETPTILTMMKEFVAAGIKPLDALHIACAQALDCQYFLTVDKDILKKAQALTGIQILNPIDFVIEQGL
jgi:predicted nucleic acid-binding protein